MKRWLCLPTVMALALLACTLGSGTTAGATIPPPTVSATVQATPQKDLPPIHPVTFTPDPILASPPAATLFPPPLASGTPLPPPTAVAPVSTADPDASYVLAEEQVLGSYALRLWHNAAPESEGFDSIATIAAAGQPLAQIESALGFASLTGTDITGEGHPDVVVETFTGGAHCCFATYVYDLGPTMTRVLETIESNCGGEFADLDGDGVLEFTTCDDSFAYLYCAYAGSPLVRVIYAYEPGQGYLPASPRFANAYLGDIATHTTLAAGAQPGAMGELDDTTKCSVLPLVLDYLYSGDSAMAWAEFERLYTYPDAATFRAEIEQTASESTRFATP